MNDTTPIAPAIADDFLLRRDIVFLNHGSFGACPRPVFDVYQQWQRELEAQPVEFLGRRISDLLAQARASLAEYVGAAAEDIVFVPNATHGVNIVARSLDLQPGDEVLATDHEYGAADRTWRYICAQRGARYINQPIALPITDEAAFVEQLWAGVTERTRIIFLSHITSPTALIFPIQAICRRARERGILTVIDGAHAPGQIPLALDTIGADFYTGNLHKWLCGPKGAAFLYARRDQQARLQPLVVSWGWEKINPGPSLFQDIFEWTGTTDPAAYLSVPAAIAYQAQHDWPAVRAACHALVRDASMQIGTLTGLAAICPENWYAQMCAVPLPPCDSAQVKARLYDEHQIEVPIIDWNGRQFVRVSIQAYNSSADVARLMTALRTVLRK